MTTSTHPPPPDVPIIIEPSPSMSTTPSTHPISSIRENHPEAAGHVRDVGIAPPPYEEMPASYSAPRQLTWAHATAAVAGDHTVPSPPPHKPRSFLEPLELPSPFTKASKARVSNFREGLKEGGRGAWAEVREGLKGPVGLTWYWAKEGGVFGALGGLGYGTTILALCPISASIAFLNHSSRGAIRSVRSAKTRRQESKTTTRSPSLSASHPSTSPTSVMSISPNALSMRRTSTMESAMTSRSRRSRIGTLLTRVTSIRTSSQTGPITPPDERNVDGDSGVVIGDEERVTPFPVSGRGSGEMDERPILPMKGKKEIPTTGIELETKWGLPTSPMTEGSRGIGEGSGWRRDEEVNQVEMDTKWGGGVLAPLGEPVMPHPWTQGEAGPSGTPQLERDIKWPVPESSSSPIQRDFGAVPEYTNPPRQAIKPAEREEEVTRLEMDLKWENELARAGGS